MDFIVIGMSLVIFIFYLATLFLLIEVKKRLTKEAGIAIVYFILSLVSLIIRRISQIFSESEIIPAVPYFRDLITLVFAILFFLAVFHFKRAIESAARPSVRERVGNILSSYRKKLGR